MGKANRRSHGQWCGLIEKQASGEESVAGFCRRRGLSASAFYYHKHRARQESGTIGFDEIAPIGLCVNSGVRVIVAGSGCSLEVDRGFDAACLRDVVRALR